MMVHREAGWTHHRAVKPPTAQLHDLKQKAAVYGTSDP